MNHIRNRLGSDSVMERVACAAVLSLIVFFGVMAISYLLLPEGFLKNRNPLQNWETSPDALVLTLQIFFYNMISVAVIVMASLFGRKKQGEEHYYSVGYTAFFTLVCINAVVLGTWSFSVESEAVPLLGRVVRTFDLAHRAGLWEMTGQLFTACSTARIATVLTNGRDTVLRSMRDIHMGRAEKAVLIAGIVLVLIGALVESIAINAL